MPSFVQRLRGGSLRNFLASLWTSTLMALCLRKLDRKRDWDDPRSDEQWLAVNDLRADALRDLETEGDKLSIYRVSEQVSVQRILAALGANRDYFTKMDYILFDFAVVGDLAIAYEEVRGDTLDTAV